MKNPYKIRYSAYRKMLLSFIGLTAAIITVVCIVLFLLFSRSSAKEVGSISESMLSQTSYAANIVKKQVLDLGNQLINNNDLISAMYNREIDRIQEYQAVRTLTSIQSMYPFLEFIGLYNGYTDRYINNKGISFEDEKLLLEKLDSQNQGRYIHFFPRQIVDAVSGRNKNVITFILFPGYSSYLPKKGAVVINIDEQYLNNLITELKSRSTHFLIVLDNDGTVLSHTNAGQFMTNISDASYAKRILSSDERSDNFITEVDGRRSLVTFVKSEELNWFFISANDYQDVLANINWLKTVTLTIALGMFLICLLFSIWLTNKIYYPIQKLMKKVKSSMTGVPATKQIDEFRLLSETFTGITDKVASMEPALTVARKSYLLRYIKGSQVDLSNRFEGPLVSRNFVVIVVKIDRYQSFIQERTPKEQDLLRFAICNIAQELIETLGAADTFIVDADEIGIVLQLEGDALPPDLIAVLSGIQANMTKLFHLTLTIGVGTIGYAVEQIRESYEAAITGAERRFFEGNGNIFSSGAEASNQELRESAYPVKIENKMIEAMRQNHRDALQAELNRFMEAVSQESYQAALFYLHQLLVALYKQFEVSSPVAREQAKLFMEMAFLLPKFETLEEVSDRMGKICLAICNEMEAKLKNKNNEVIDKIKEYAAAHYMKPDLSLELLADQVQWTPGYLGKVFKMHCNMAFNDYLKHVRLEKARELLIHTNDSTNEISEKIGIYNTTYFYTLFKKKYGISPAQYRSEKLKD